MKYFPTPRNLKSLIPLCGLLGLLLRRVMVSTGTDDKGLLVPGHPAWIGLLLLCAATAALLLAGIRNVRGFAAYRVSFPRSDLTAAGDLLAAAGAAVCAFSYWRDGYQALIFTPTASVAQLLGGIVMILAPVAFALAALCRHTGRKPNFLLHVLVCVYFAIQALTLYQTRSFDPQIHHYCFELFARIALSMTAYRLAMFDTGRGSHRKLWLWGLTAVFLCCVSLDSGLFYITGAIWAFTSLSRLRRKPRYIRTAHSEE